MKIRLALMLLVLSCAVSAYASGTIDFELSAPCNFTNTIPLTNAYAGLGVNFTSGNGAILDQCSNFGVNAHSGVDFLAFNSNPGDANYIPSGPEVITFDNPVSNVSIWVAPWGDFAISDNNGNSNGVSAGNGDWVLLSLNDTNITSITLSGPAVWVADDLSWESNPTNLLDDPQPTSEVPEPSSMVLLGSGLAGVIGVARRKFGI